MGLEGLERSVFKQEAWLVQTPSNLPQLFRRQRLTVARRRVIVRHVLIMAAQTTQDPRPSTPTALSFSTSGSTSGLSSKASKCSIQVSGAMSG